MTSYAPTRGILLAVLLLSSVSSFAQGTRVIFGGDLLRIEVKESSDLDGVYSVSGDGYVNLGYAGRIEVGDMRVDEAEKSIEQVLEKELFKEATVSVDISEYVSGNILVLGAVQNPGTIPYEGGEIISILEAITMVGGFTGKAAGDQVKIFRWSSGNALTREVIEVDLDRMLHEFDFSRDQYLRPRDIIIVPERSGEEGAREFLALGEFGSPGFFPINDNMNMIRAISIAGGISREAQLDQGRILRPDSEGNYSVIPVDFSRLLGSADMDENVRILPGDIIFLPSVNVSAGGKVYFLGAVETPGMYPLVNSGNSTLVRTILQRGGMNKFANMSAVKLLRKAPDGSQQEMIFDVDKIIKTGNFDADIPLQDEDVIMISEKMFSIF